MRGNGQGGSLQRELEHRIKTGRCVYCRAPAAPDRPLTREHVIPQARGGRRKDARIIVPACAPCNQRRGCQEVVLFLLARPRRILAFLDYLATLPPDTVRQIDVRVFAELYAAVWLLAESAHGGEPWRTQLRRLCAGRRLHRRRYAARRIVTAAAVRIERARDRAASYAGPSCPIPAALRADEDGRHADTIARGMATLIGTLALVWEASADQVHEELERERRRAHRTIGERHPGHPALATEPADDEEDDDDARVVSLDGWKRRGRGRRRRSRVDAKGRRGAARGRGRAA
ncbi:HNH endonuclease [Longimicrobium sp.]|uniref:HNH endonuclease n=1 Tax=Longimicrobium sp. TaxID=2029185 RepID=UPI002E3084C6|nr:HNH endonuclease [Longimicrobium sp.]HEX6038504.1 HNH endonuclease [Longimicrobium sp.]